MPQSAMLSGWNTAFFSGIFTIILIDIVLSGDNSIVIALAVRTLPAQKQRLGLLVGAVAAAALRVLFTFIASHLMRIPWLKLGGGLLILWIAVKLLSENEDPDPGHREAHSLFHAMWIIMVADLTMSLDNVLAVAGASKGSLPLLWLGLGFSIPLVMFASGILARLMERFPVIIVLGAMILGKVGADMITEDPALPKYISDIPHLRIAGQIAGMGLILLTAVRIRRIQSKTSPPKSSGD